jgi:hypothetical protein
MNALILRLLARSERWNQKPANNGALVFMLSFCVGYLYIDRNTPPTPQDTRLIFLNNNGQVVPLLDKKFREECREKVNNSNVRNEVKKGT